MNKRYLLLLLINTIAISSASSLELHNAALNGDITRLMRAFRDKTPLDLKDVAGKTALHWAARNKKDLALKYYSTGTLTAQFLIEHGANPDIFDNREKRPIDVALHTGNESLAALLMQYSHPEIPLQNGSTFFETAIDRFEKKDDSLFRALMKNPEFDVTNGMKLAQMSGNFMAASFMRQLEAQRTLAQTRGQKRKSGYQEENPAAKRQKLEEEVCFCCQEKISCASSTTVAFTCSHQVHQDCLDSLLQTGYNQCQICQASLKKQSAMPTNGKTVAQQEQEEKDAMIANLLAAGAIGPDDLPFI